MNKELEKQKSRKTANPQQPSESSRKEGNASLSGSTQHTLEILRKKTTLLEEILDPENIEAARLKTMRNKGAAGIDGMTVAELSSPKFSGQWPQIRDQILNGTFKPHAVRAVSIPKPHGGTRMLGIPTVMDRLIQQATMAVLQRYIDSSFSESSYGYRPGRSAKEAVLQAKAHIDAGYEIIVEIDLEKFFDQVNQDRLMSQLKKVIGDQRVLNLIRTFLNSGVMMELESKRMDKGIPQGSPLSPLLSNIYLDCLDKELERRGHRYVRYADDCSVFTRSAKAGIRVLESVSRWIEKKLKVRVNSEKSKTSTKGKILGFEVCKRGIAIGLANIEKLKSKVRTITSIRGGCSSEAIIKELTPLLRGWWEYFKIKTFGKPEKYLDKWIRRRVRACIYDGFKTAQRRYNIFIAARVSRKIAYSCAHSAKGTWGMSQCKAMHFAYSNQKLKSMGLFSLTPSTR